MNKTYLWFVGGSSPIAVRYSSNVTFLSPDVSHALNIDCATRTNYRNIFTQLPYVHCVCVPKIIKIQCGFKIIAKIKECNILATQCIVYI